MLLLRRTHELLGVEAGQRVVRALAHLSAPALRVYVAQLRGGQRFDAGMMNKVPTQLGMGAQALCFVLGGELVIRAGGGEHTVREHAFASMDVLRWDERWDGEFSVLVVEWGSDASLARFGAGRLGRADRADLEAFAARLTAGQLQGEGAARSVCDLLARLEAAGLAVPRLDPRELFERAPPGAQALCDALGQTLSRLDGGPQLVELTAALGVSERHVRRRLGSLGEWLPNYSEPSAWRRKLRILRTHVAAGFLTTKGASQEAVARSVGYGSARALSLAFEQEGLPRPATFRLA